LEGEFFPFINGFCDKPSRYKSDIPAWSVKALIDALPPSVKTDKGVYWLNINKERVKYERFDYIEEAYDCILNVAKDSVIDMFYETILKLNEMDLL
jgi:hypothetical protein